MALAALACVARLCVPLLRDDLVLDDHLLHLWWYLDVSDPGLFAGNYPFRYFSSGIYSPPLYHWIMTGLSGWLGPVPGAVLLAVALALVTGTLLWRLGTRLAGDSLGGFAAVVAWLAFPAALGFRLLDGLGRVDDGLPRSLMLPLLLAFLYFLIERRMVALGFTILAAALSYPVVGLPMFVMLIMVFGHDVYLARRIPPGWYGLAILGVMAAAAFVVFNQRLPAEFGPTVDLATAKTMATFQPGGRSRFFEDSIYAQIVSSSRSGFGASIADVVLVGLTLAAAGWLRLRLHRFELKALLLAGLASWAVSYLLAFQLYLPGRHLRSVANIGAVLLVGVVVSHAARRLADRVPLRAWIVGALAWVAIAQGYSSVSTIRREVDEQHAAIMQDIVALPRGAVVAAHPADADPIPLLGRHPVPVSHEMFQPFHLGYFRRMEAEVAALAVVLRAERFDAAMAYGASHGVSYLLVDARRAAKADRFLDHHFPDDGPAVATRWYADVGRSVPAERIVSRRGPWAIIDVRP